MISVQNWICKVLPNDVDLSNPPAEQEKRKHKLKRLAQSPNSFFMVLKLIVGAFDLNLVIFGKKVIFEVEIW
ncbi:hypothetical protein H5410_037552 [Solanum commersonii]|uniref:Uncharacterized protein n=1 Tax=Solanum commersonii TaxID=4109 RepID=A0A9J5Y9V0_SOLCO|nr:hypothetical protein H5410_037552 [Solanum commersonii]